jgi:hypothetical protein
MTIKSLLDEYIDGHQTAIRTIRTLSGMFEPKHAIAILTLICAITRVEEGDLDKETFKEIYAK